MFLPQRDPAMVFLFFSSLPSLLRGLKGENLPSSFPYDFPAIVPPAADRNPFLARDPQEKQRTLWSGVLRSIVADIRPFLLPLLLLRFLAQFLFSCLPPIRSTPERSSFCYPHGPLLVFLRIIYLLLQFFHVRIVVCYDPLENWIVIIVKWKIFLEFVTNIIQNWIRTNKIFIKRIKSLEVKKDEQVIVCCIDIRFLKLNIYKTVHRIERYEIRDRRQQDGIFI